MNSQDVIDLALVLFIIIAVCDLFWNVLQVMGMICHV
jgi:hypothetical protein